MNILKTICLFCLCFFMHASLMAQGGVKVVVDVSGHGDFKNIQDAINSLSDSAAKPRTIYIKKGVYHEKVFIAKHNIILKGEDREKTIITYDIARDEWRCDHADDWGVATLNLNGNDITLLNLTIANDYGFNQQTPRSINCSSDSTGKKIITNNGHQMALRSILSTRLKAINCRFRAYAGDTVSPWNTTNGMFYFKDCVMEGGVDFYCPRGWAYAENCTFYANTGAASIWHDGTGNINFKTVLKHCTFDGFEGFQLGRYHREAQFYLIDCTFSNHMANKPIYFVPGNKLKWGERIYYYNCHRKGGDFDWFRNNLQTARGAPEANDITPAWVFQKVWQPQVALEKKSKKRS